MRYGLRRSFCLVIIYAVLSTAVLASDAKGIGNSGVISTVPQSIDNETDFLIRITGVWPDSCVPRNLLVQSISAERIEFEFATPSDAVCGSAWTPYELAVDPQPGNEAPIVFASNVEVTLRDISARATDPNAIGEIVAQGNIEVLDVVDQRLRPLPLETGFWWHEPTPGIGYALDLQSGFLFFTVYENDAQRQPVWSLSQGELVNGRFSEQRLRSQGPGLFVHPDLEVVGSVDLVFAGSSEAWLSLDGGPYTKITRFRTVSPGSLQVLNAIPGRFSLPDLSGRWIELVDTDGDLSARAIDIELVVRNEIRASFADPAKDVLIDCEALPLLPEFTQQTVICTYARVANAATPLPQLAMRDNGIDRLFFSTNGEMITLHRPVVQP